MDRYEPNRPDDMTGGSDIPEKMKKTNNPPHHPTDNPWKAKDGFDNTGTQGYDSLSDEGYTGSSDNAGKAGPDSHTGSSSEDFKELRGNEDVSDEDRTLDGGI